MPDSKTETLQGRIDRIERGTAMPLWSQVRATLTTLIREDGLKEHDRLPSENELCKSFGVSRTVIREALSQMVNEGLIYRLQGKGAFVRGRRDEQNFVGTTMGFSGEMAEKKQDVTRRILRQEVTYPTPRISRMLRIDPTHPIVVVDRVMSVESVPRMIVRWAMLQESVPGLERIQLENRSLYDTINRQFGVRLVRADRWIEAVSLSVVDAELLGVEAGKAALKVESVCVNEAGHPIEYYVATFLTDRSRLHLSVSSVG
ncbi:MAG: GntR family transcriptional regulator [Alphaproteobacteria bacterium]|nr:GntR family transcriptional regulator [Alphaproteobacteria bacterium]MBU1279231.1 GntR family transcriptional regulator [Alphaproteobacteria bacterium]MBU1573753.1 GntR family transcriptional regulator [Alphaproteobacteria bacterium]MBU1826984.1 GntR family transcriptional regulator [Alphaproteobacteria bacterium]MBU2077624.1 GntR family transcriptional regulator [Alphaproteobacteria bacterium]